MGFYENHVLPHILNVAMNTKPVRDERTRSLENVKGTVLEVGLGTGLNLPHYPPTVTKLVGVDPSATGARLARKRIAASPFPVQIIEQLEHGYLKGAPKFGGFLYRGVAKRSGS